MLTEEQVKYIAKLARLGLKPEEIQKYQKQLTNILEYVDILGEVSTENVEETSQVTGLKNVMEADVVLSGQSAPEELLNCSPLPVDSNQIRVKRII